MSLPPSPNGRSLWPLLVVLMLALIVGATAVGLWWSMAAR